MQIRPTAFTIGLIIHFSIALFCVYTEFGIDSKRSRMRPCCYAFSGVACTMSPYGAFKEKPPALPGDVYYILSKV